MANTIPPQTRSSRNTPPTTPPAIAPTGVLVELADGATDTGGVTGTDSVAGSDGVACTDGVADTEAQELKLRFTYKSQRGFNGLR